MEEHDDELRADTNILSVFHLLHLLSVLPYHNYEVYDLTWGNRQNYIYRMLSLPTDG